MTERVSLGNFSRRNFIKGAAALGAAGLLTGCSAQTSGSNSTQGAAPETKIYSGACRSQCGQGCYLNVHVRDGQIVRTTAGHFEDGPEFDRICPKGLSQPARVYSAERLQYPMRRIGERGEGKFERITWDEAIKEITDKWKGYTEKFGPQSIAFFLGSGNTGHLGGGAPDGSVMEHLLNVMGASRVLPDRDIATPMKWAHIFGQNFASTTQGAWGAKHHMIWGGDTAVSQKQLAHFVLEERDEGTELTVIDIAYRTMAQKADRFVAVHPGTDGALALGMCRAMFDNGWVHMDFLRDHTEAPFLIKEDGKFFKMSDLGVEPTEGPVNPLTGKPTVIDPCIVWDEEAGTHVPYAKAVKPKMENVPAIKGVAVRTEFEVLREYIMGWTVERASEVCGVPVEQIVELAKIYACDGPVTTDMKFGLNHYNNGLYSTGCVCCVLLLSGNFGVQGAGVWTGEPNFGTGNNAACSKMPSSKGEPVKGASININWSYFYDIVHTGKRLGKDFPIKAFYASCTNIVSNQTEQNETLKLMKELEFIVIQDITMNDTALYADILLPACYWFENEDLRVRYYCNPYLLWNEKAIEPMYESKPDVEIYKMLGTAMGYGDYFDFDNDDYLDLWLSTAYGKQNGINMKMIREKKYVRWVNPAPIGAKDGIFTTDSKRAKFYRENPQADYQMGQDFDQSKEKLACYWEPAREADLANPIREKYPFVICCEHMRTRTHTQWYDVDYMKEFEKQPVCRINPEDAAELGIKEGDKVRLYNDRGSVTMLAVLNPGQQRKAVHCPRSFLTREHIAGDLATTTFNDYNQACRNQAYFDCAVAIEKA